MRAARFLTKSEPAISLASRRETFENATLGESRGWAWRSVQPGWRTTDV